VLIRAIGWPERLRDAARFAIADSASFVVVSAASVWEAAIKIANGKLTIPMDLADAVDRSAFDRLDVTIEHGLAAGALPRHHRDPFDRLLIAQAQLEGLTLVTTDRALAVYDVALLPA
jgi:PIN domain nuclease of toxin-antitoxin system